MNTKIFITIALIGSFWSCEPPVVFSAPQPVGVAAITEIPENYSGIYWCGLDSINLYVNKSLIYKSKLFEIALSKEEINATKELSYNNGQLFFGPRHGFFPATEKNDTVYSKLIVKDTVFSTQDPNRIVKNFKGHLILNHKINEGSWEVKIMSRSENGYLKISSVAYSENLKNIDSITSAKVVEDSYREQLVVSPTKAEFGTLLEDKILFGSSCQEFEPVKPTNKKIFNK